MKSFTESMKRVGEEVSELVDFCRQFHEQQSAKSDGIKKSKLEFLSHAAKMDDDMAKLTEEVKLYKKKSERLQQKLEETEKKLEKAREKNRGGDSSKRESLEFVKNALVRNGVPPTPAHAANYDQVEVDDEN